MSASGDEDHEHWPSDNKYYTEPEECAAINNGLRSHNYLIPRKPSPELMRKDSKSPSPSPTPAPAPAPTQAPYHIPHPAPIYYAAHPSSTHLQTPQYYSYPVPIYTGQQGGYFIPYSATAPNPTPSMAPPRDEHVYIPAYDKPKSPPAPAAPKPPSGPQPNLWLGRTKTQVEEDNMKLAKKEGVYDKRTMVPSGLDEDQMCWVVELDGGHSLRAFRDVKGMTGEWKEDKRFERAYYFVREEEEKKKEKK